MKAIERNVGTTDQIIRFLLGAVIVILGFYFKSWWGLIGLIPLATASFGFCPVYYLLGINTCEARRARAKARAR